MTAQIDVVTLGVNDINVSKKFYHEGLGCPIDQDHGGFVSFKLGDGSAGLALYTRDALADDAGVSAEGSGFRGVTFNYIVPFKERVDEVMAQAEKAGAAHHQGQHAVRVAHALSFAAKCGPSR